MARQKFDSLDVMNTQDADPNAVIGTIKLVNGRIVGLGQPVVRSMAKQPHGNRALRGGLVDPKTNPKAFLKAVVEQYDGSRGIRVAWSEPK